MIILYEKNEREFISLGLGVLRDALSCGVSEGLNDAYELEMEYPIDGLHFNKITLQRIIFAKPNQYDNPQPFRIYNITKPLNGIITINAEHISYDMSGYTVKPFDAIDLEDTLQKIQNGSILPSPFTFHTDMIVPVSMKTKIPYNMRALLAGDSGSVLDIYNGHYKFDKFEVHLLANRGEDRGVVIRYGKNMTELEQEISSEKIYTGIFPFYSAKNTTTQVVMTRFFKSAYEVPTSRPLSVNWFSWSDGGKPFIPLLEDIPVQNKTPGENFNLVYCFKKEIPQLVYVRTADIEFSQTWLSADNDDGAALTPQVKTIYKVVSEGSYQNKNYIWTGTEYELYEGDGFYYIPDPTPEPPEVIPETQTIETEDYIDLSTEEDSGIIYIDELADPQRILTLDISSEFGEKPTAEVLRGKALDYLLNNDIQELVNSTTVSFIKLADSPEYKRFEDLETVKLGDTVKIIYEKLGVEASLQVIKTVFNVITEKYTEIELGKKAANLADSALTKNDSVSSLTNDARYTDQITVKKFIAETITADYIQAKNANLSVAQIEQLETARIRVTGLIEASMVDIDKIVSRLLVADDADIKNVLTAGEIVVKGTIYAEAGDIGGCTIQDGKLVVSTSISIANETFKVDENGNMIASSVTITGGTLNIGDGAFQVDNDGHLIATSAEIQGDVKITSGEITIGENFSVDQYGNVMIGSGSININDNFEVDSLGNVLIKSGSIDINGNFTVDNTGHLTAKSIDITGGSIQIGTAFTVDINGNLTASSVTITGGSITIGDNFSVDEYGNVIIGGGSININNNFSVDDYGNVMIGAGSININDNFEVDEYGHLTAKEANIEGDITGGSININDLFIVHPDGKVEVRSGEIEIGGSLNDSFKVDDSGNLSIGGDGVFQVSNDGKMIATEAIIYGDINADKIENIEKIVFKDLFTEIQPVIGSSTREDQVVNITTIDTTIEQPDGHEVWLNFYLNKPLWYAQVISVSYNYVVSKYGGSNNTFIRTKTFIIPAEVTSYTTFTGDYILPHDGYIPSASVSSYTPGYFVETRITSSEGYLGVDSNFAPLYNSGYSLGTSDSPWGDVYSDNEPIITSDKRSKKEINYDLEIYDKVYHSLKPVTYKKNNGKAGRKHLGLIAQDVKQVLDENNISTNDFAIFIASIKEDSKLKNKDDLTDEDINYGLRYSELHALHIRQIQLLKTQVQLLESRIKTLEDKDEGSS